MIGRSALVAVVLVTQLLGCAAPPDRLTVYAAASLRDAFADLAESYQDEAGRRLTLAFDASSMLRAQIEHGAPADVFVAADERHPTILADAGLTDGDVTPFARSPLAIVVPADGAGRVAAWTDLAVPGVRIVAAGEAVPVSTYADQLVESLASLPDAPPGFAEAVAANVVSREDNARAVLAKVEVGEGDAAVVYAVDARTSEAIRTLALPREAHVAATYAAVVVAGSDRPAAAAAFVAWLGGATAQAILAAHGLLPGA